MHEHFLSLLAIHLENFLGRDPIIHKNRPETLTGSDWSLQLKESLAYSRVLVTIWSPPYFKNPWCVYECAMMLDREHQLKEQATENLPNLILAVIISDGDNFPEFTTKIRKFDCREFVVVGPVFDSLPIYYEFQKRMRVWAKEMALVIKQAPEWRQTWCRDPILDIRKVPIPTFRLPKLG